MTDNPGITSQLASCHLQKYIFHAMFEKPLHKNHAKMITSQINYHAKISRQLNAKQRPEHELANE